MSSEITETSLIQLLSDQAGISHEDLQRAQRLSSGHDSGEIFVCLVRLGVLSEQELARSWAQVAGIPLIESQEQLLSMTVHEGVSERFQRFHKLLVMTNSQGQISLLMANPADQSAIASVRYMCGLQPEVMVAAQTLVENLLEQAFGEGRSAMNSLIETLDNADDGRDDDIEMLKDQASEAPVIRLVNLILQRAVEVRASDIHLEPFETTLKVRYRVDGVLQETDAPPASSAAAVISRIKIMAGLDIAERRLPQDGRIVLRLQGRALDLRVSTLPTVYGESVVMRLLDRENVELSFAHLGFDEAFINRFSDLLNSPHGILLVTGPTGSGKTTTLYTALSQLNQSERKIITVEDPVEYQLEGINQIQVKPSIGLDFSDALRSIMRQDPDVIMIGEMRDLATCRIAIQSALTGHLVLSTLHTNSALESLTRLLEMGVESYLLASTLRGVLAQRLVRRLDPETRIPYEPDAELIARLKLDELTTERPIRLYRADETAPGGGYRGRCAINELLPIDEKIRSLMLSASEVYEIETYAREHLDFYSLHEDGLRQVVNGTTSLEELFRVTGSGA